MKQNTVAKLIFKTWFKYKLWNDSIAYEMLRNLFPEAIEILLRVFYDIFPENFFYRFDQILIFF